MSDTTGTESVPDLGLYRASGIGQTTTNSIRYPVGDDVASIEDLLSTIGVTAVTASSPSASFCPSLNSWPPSTSGNYGGGKHACGQIGEDLASAFATSLDSAASLDGVRLRSNGSRCNQLAVPSSSQPMADGDVEDFQMSPLSPSVKTRRDPSTIFVSSSSMSSSSSSSASSNCDVGNFPPMSGTSIDGTQQPQSVSSSSATDLQAFPPSNGSWFERAAAPGCQQQQLQRGGIVDADLVDAEDDDMDRLRHSSSSNLGAVKRSANMTECVPVPSSEHVAEIVGRQGCKIKALRAKTNTYIKTPVRGDDPVFVITGRREDVACARREILSAAEHFSQIRASRRGGPGNGNTLSSQPLACSSTTQNPPASSTASESSPPITSQVRSCGGNSPTGAFPAGGGPPLLSVAATGAISTSTAGNSSSSDRPMAQRSSTAAAGIESATSGQLVGQGHVTIEVRVPVRVVGQVVGPKGATIKRIQAETGTYIVTPSRGTDPIFEIVGCPGNVERARREIESFAALGGGSTQASRSSRPVDRVGMMNGSGLGKTGTFGAHHVTNGDASSDWSKLIATAPSGRVCSSLMAAGLVSPLDLLRTGGGITDADPLHQVSGSSVGTLEHQQLTAAAAAAMMMKRLCLDESAGNGFRKQNLMSKANGEDLGSAILAQAMTETYHRQQQQSDYDNGINGSVLTPSLLSSLNQNWPIQFPPPHQQQQQPTTPKFDSRLGNFDIWNSATASDDDVAMLLLGNSTFGFKPDANSPSSPLRYGRPNCLFGVGPSFSAGNDGGWVDSSAAAHVMQSWFDGNITSSGFKQSLTGNSNSTGGSRSPSSSPTNGSVGSPVTSGFPMNQSSSVGLF